MISELRNHAAAGGGWLCGGGAGGFAVPLVRQNCQLVVGRQGRSSKNDLSFSNRCANWATAAPARRVRAPQVNLLRGTEAALDVATERSKRSPTFFLPARRFCTMPILTQTPVQATGLLDELLDERPSIWGRWGQVEDVGVGLYESASSKYLTS